MDKYTIDDILNAIVDEKPVDLQAAVNSMMVNKAHDQIADLKTLLVQDMLVDKEEDTASDEDEEIEDEINDEDEVEELDADELFTDDNEEQE